MKWILTLTMLLAFGGVAGAQEAAPAADSAAAPPASPPPPPPRASWLSDRILLRPGDLLTVVVDEKTAARERVGTVAQGNRSQKGRIDADLDGDAMRYAIGTSLDRNSKDVGEANRSGNLTAVLTVRVTGIEEGGIARIEGVKTITVDGRSQKVALTGRIRPEDVSRKNLVSSDRIADAVITYDGKKIGPRAGIIGGILALLWP